MWVFIVGGTTAVLSLIVVPVVVMLGMTGLGQVARGAPSSDIPAVARLAYQRGAQECPGLSWEVLAGIGKVETDHGRAPLPGVVAGANPMGAEGPMQFLPSTFAAYGIDATDGDEPSPYDIDDATLAAARMLCANGAATESGLRHAIWTYNHSDAYVSDVLGWAVRYEDIGVGPAGSSRGRLAASWALAQLGHPYAWGGAGPDAFDCSGLVLRAWEAAGVELPRVAADQYRAGVQVPLADAVPGDLVFFASDLADPGSIDHVGMIIGPGAMVDAPHSGAVVRVTPVYDGAMPAVVRPG